VALVDPAAGGDARLNHAEVVAYCLAKPGATPDEPWEEDLVAKVGGKLPRSKRPR
jgi:hypothetical protein